MRKLGARTRRAATVPPIIATVVEPQFEIKLRSCVEAFRFGIAEGEHHADLADTHDLMLLAIEHGPRYDRSVAATLEVAGVALRNIFDRYNDKGRWGATGDELQAIQLLAEVSMDYWRRRSGALYAECRARLAVIRRKQYLALQEAA